MQENLKKNCNQEMLFEVSEARLRIPWIRNDLLPNLFSLKN
jgi:hypothetical protein